MKTRIYKIASVIDGHTSLIRAISFAQAIAFVARQDYNGDMASQEDIVAHLKAGHDVFDAAAEGSKPRRAQLPERDTLTLPLPLPDGGEEKPDNKAQASEPPPISQERMQEIIAGNSDITTLAAHDPEAAAFLAHLTGDTQ